VDQFENVLIRHIFKAAVAGIQMHRCDDQDEQDEQLPSSHTPSDKYMDVKEHHSHGYDYSWFNEPTELEQRSRERKEWSGRRQKNGLGYARVSSSPFPRGFAYD